MACFVIGEGFYTLVVGAVGLDLLLGDVLDKSKFDRGGVTSAAERLGFF